MKILKVLGFAALVGTVLLVLAGFAGALHPLFDSIGHFRLQLTVLLAFCILVCLALNLRIASIAAALIGAFSLYSMSPVGPIGMTPVEGMTRLNLVQFNALFSNKTPQKSADWIRAQTPDVVTLQEVSKLSRTIITNLQVELPHQLDCGFATVGGVAVLSKHPITASNCLKGEGLVWVRLDVNGKAVTVASLHLHWPYPYGQAAHIRRLAPEFAKMPRPIVLAGDFNAAPWSYAVSEIAELTDTQVMPGVRLTLRMGPPPLGPAPFLPIDHILVPHDATLQSIEKGPAIGSDHHPVRAQLWL